jgi:uracil phosphoribosyltransferase
MTILRDQTTANNYFRTLVKEITSLMMFTATHDLKLEKKAILTPVEAMIGQQLTSDVLVIPILRAGLGMLDAFTEMIPSAGVGHIGLARDESTLQPKAYIVKLPKIHANTKVFILDPMLATGGSLNYAIQKVKEKGAKHITYMGLVGVQEGIQTVQSVHPDVKMFLASLDKGLNQHGFIVPGLGDCGDRLYGKED